MTERPYAVFGLPEAPAGTIEKIEDALVDSGLEPEWIEPTTFVRWWGAPGAWCGVELPPEQTIALAGRFGATVCGASAHGDALTAWWGPEREPLRFDEAALTDLARDPVEGPRWFPLAVAKPPAPASLRSALRGPSWVQHRLELLIDRALAAQGVPRPGRLATRKSDGWRPCRQGDQPHWVTRVRQASTRRVKRLGDGRLQLLLQWADGERFSPVLALHQARACWRWFEAARLEVDAD